MVLQRMARVNKEDIVDFIAENLDEDIVIPKMHLKEVLDLVFAAMKTAFANEQGVQITGFGTFKPVIRAAKLGVNPQTKKRIKIPEKRSVTFKVSPQFKAEMNEKEIVPIKG